MTESAMRAARLHGPSDIRVDRVPQPGEPPPGWVLVRVATVGICGSDLHAYRHGPGTGPGRQPPLILGHEFAGVVEHVNGHLRDGQGQPLRAGLRVAVDPAHACGTCEWCRRGDPNLCPNIAFLGLAPTNGALCPLLHVPAADCFVLPSSIDATVGALIEPLGVAIHTLDLARPRIGQRVAVVGCGPIGLCVLRLLSPRKGRVVLAADRLAWRADRAEQMGATGTFCRQATDLVDAVLHATGGRGVDVAIETANGGEALQQCAAMLAPGGRLIVVGIDPDDRLLLRHSTARRKGLTIRMVRRMKYCCPRAIRLAQRDPAGWADLVTHRFRLAQAADAFALNADYRDGVVKVMIDIVDG